VDGPVSRAAATTGSTLKRLRKILAIKRFVVLARSPSEYAPARRTPFSLKSRIGAGQYLGGVQLPF
jgi:hypothetical protein